MAHRKRAWGWLLARSWGLSDRIANAIRYHHDPEAYILPEKELPSDALALIAVSVIAEHVLGDYTHDAHAVGGACLGGGSSDASAASGDEHNFVFHGAPW